LRLSESFGKFHMTTRDTSLGIPIERKGGRGHAGTIAVLLVFIALAVVLYTLDWNPRSAGFLSDDAVYLMMADAFSPFHSGESALTQYILRQSLFPPMYPLLLGLLGGGSGALLWSHLITTTTLVLAIGFYGLWVFSETRNRIAAAVLIAIFALSPGTLLLSLDFFSEFPYLLFSLLALYLASRDDQTRSSYAAIVVAVALAAITRSAGFSLLLATAIWMFVHRIRGRFLWVAVLVAPTAIWSWYKARFIGSSGGYDRLWLTVWEQLRDHPTQFVPQFVHDQSLGLWRGLLSDLGVRPTALTEAIALLILITAVPAWIARLRVSKLDAWYLLIGGGMLCLYPFPTFFSRLLLPWLPIIFFYSYLTLSKASARLSAFRGKPAFAYAGLAAIVIATMPSIAFFTERFFDPIPPELVYWKHTRYWYRVQSVEQILSDLQFRSNLITASEALQQWVPEGQCVFTVHTAIVMLYGRRVSQQPPPPHLDDAGFAKRGSECEYFLLLSSPGSVGDEAVAPFYPAERFPANAMQEIHSWTDPNAPDHLVAVLLRRIPPA
jgi:hypothetical protein